VNILFVNYGDFTTNSLNHIGGFAGALAEQGHACAVAVPSGKNTLAAVSNPSFIPVLCDEVLAQPAIFPHHKVADILHAWTPRECVRKFVLAYQRNARKPARLIVHLEDNEEYLISGFAQRTTEDLRSMGFSELESIMSDSLPHPVRHRTFLRVAEAATVIVERLREFVPATVPCSVLSPGVDPSYLKPFKADPELRRELGLHAKEKVIVFTGSNTFANEPEMRDLYAAVHALNKRGTPTRLVRTGFNRPQFLESLTPELTAHVLDLGFIAKARLPRLLGIADVLVQPGKPGPFNDYRLPSKLPEFLSSGRPVVLPPTNIALLMRDGDDALFLGSGTPENIADCCERIFGDPDLAARLGRNGAAFARKHFDLATNTAGLLALYESVLRAPERPVWDAIRGASDLTAVANEIADALQPGKGPADPAETSRLASDLAVIVRLEDERLSSQADASDKARIRLEETIHQLELQRDMTNAHVRNLEAQVEFQDRQQKLQKRLTDTHIQNLESSMREIEAAARKQIEAVALENAAASREHAKLTARMIEMDAELKARERRLKAIVHSRAWKLAAPLRDLERFLQGLFRKAAPAEAEAPLAPAGDAPAPPAPPASPRRSPPARPMPTPSILTIHGPGTRRPTSS
jgi:glycosyltransferase involved in cell wall biosynthesis